MEYNKPGKQGKQTKHYRQTSFVGEAPLLGYFASEFDFVFDSGIVVQLCKYENICGSRRLAILILNKPGYRKLYCTMSPYFAAKLS